MAMRYCASFAATCVLAFALACSSPPRPTTPALTPQIAGELLQYDTQAQTWLTYVRRQNPSCDYKLDLPEQRAHPTEVDLSHIMWCGNRPAPTEFDASVSFMYDANRHQWVIRKFYS